MRIWNSTLRQNTFSNHLERFRHSCEGRNDGESVSKLFAASILKFIQQLAENTKAQ